MNPIELPTNFGAFLTWIGSDVAIGAILVFLWNWNLLANLKTWVRVIILAVVALVLAVGSYLGVTYIPAGVIDQIQPYYRIVVMVITILAGILGTNGVALTYQNYMLNTELKVLEKKDRVKALRARTEAAVEANHAVKLMGERG